MPKELIVGETFDSTDGAFDGFVHVAWGKSTGVQLAVTYDGIVSSFFDMSRADINRLIRVLRRARDAAYGADA